MWIFIGDVLLIGAKVSYHFLCLDTKETKNQGFTLTGLFRRLTFLLAGRCSPLLWRGAGGEDFIYQIKNLPLNFLKIP